MHPLLSLGTSLPSKPGAVPFPIEVCHQPINMWRRRKLIKSSWAFALPPAKAHEDDSVTMHGLFDDSQLEGADRL